MIKTHLMWKANPAQKIRQKKRISPEKRVLSLQAIATCARMNKILQRGQIK